VASPHETSQKLSMKLPSCFLASTCKGDCPVLHNQLKSRLKLCCSPIYYVNTGVLRSRQLSLLCGKKTKTAVVLKCPSSCLYRFSKLYCCANMHLKVGNSEATRNLSHRRENRRSGGRLLVLSDRLYDSVKKLVQNESFVFEENFISEDVTTAQATLNLTGDMQWLWRLEELFRLGRLQDISREDARLLLREAAGRGDTSTILCIISKLENSPTKPEYLDYCCLIVSLLVQRDLEGIRRVLEDWIASKKWTLDGNRVHILIDLCFRLINDCAVSEILQIVDYIYEVGGRATTQTWNRILGVAGKSDYEQVLIVYRKMLRLDKRALNQTTYNLLISIFKYSRDWNKSAAWVGRMLYSGLKPDAYTCNNLLDICLYSREYFRAKYIIAFMKHHQIAPDICTYTQLLRLSGRIPSFDDANSSDAEIGSSRAIRHIWNLVSNKMQPDLTFYNALIDAFVRVGDISGAQEAFDSLSSQCLEPDLISYNSLMHGYARKGDVSKCLNLMQKMREAEVGMDARTYCIGIVACKNAGDPDRAMKIYFEAYENGCAQGEVLHHAAFTACGPKLENARRIWKAMTAIHQPGFASYKGFLGCCGAAGRIDVALDIVKEMKERGLVPTRELFVAFLNASKRYKKLYRGVESRYYNMLRKECGIIVL